MRVRLETLGCRLNIGEVESMARQLAEGGHRVVGPGETADLCILNTCTVTAVAAKKSRHLLRQLRRTNPDARLVVTGCWSELEPGKAEATGADLVVGNEAKDLLVEILAERGLLVPGDPVEAPESSPIAASRHTRAFVKVQDGCDNRCAFCIVTVARGAGRSVPAEAVVAEIRRLQELGFREAVLSGVHLGSWGHDLEPRSSLVHLVRRILAETSMERIRLSSLEPWDLAPPFFELLAEPRIQPHLHLPLQSGCDATLRRMARKTTTRDFAALVEAARAAHPDVAVSTDVMAGFPGETEAEFEESIAFVEAMGFSRLHVFRFSPREGTPAAAMPGRVPGPVVQERARRLHELGARLERDFAARFLGRTLPVLWEEAEPHGHALRHTGLTPNYLRVLTDTPPGTTLANTVTLARLLEPVPGGIVARIEDPPPGKA